jgi:hypothetical protein
MHSIYSEQIPLRRGDVYSGFDLIGYRCDLPLCCKIPLSLRPIFNAAEWRVRHSKRGPHKGSGVVHYRGGRKTTAERSVKKRDIARIDRLVKEELQVNADIALGPADARYSGSHLLL